MTGQKEPQNPYPASKDLIDNNPYNLSLKQARHKAWQEGADAMKAYYEMRLRKVDLDELPQSDERIKEILSEVATKAVMICPAIPNIDYYAQQIADLDKLPQPDNPDLYYHGHDCRVT